MATAEKLFSECRISSLVLKNRFVRSATQEGLADNNGFATEELIQKLMALAENELGLIITGHAFVHPDGRAGKNQLSCSSDETLPSLQRITEAVHSKNGRVFLQLAHAGGNACDAVDATGPSVFPRAGGNTVCREMTFAEIQNITDCFVRSAIRARQAGFDGIQIHAAHGYLLSQFLSPSYNRRMDVYGGSTENRARFLSDVVTAVRLAVGSDYPVIVKINSQDFTEDGLTQKECLEVCMALQMRGLSGIELSGGIPLAKPEYSSVRTIHLNEGDAVYYEECAKKLKQELSIPVILVGGIRFFQTAERLVAGKSCDFISLSRPLIRESNLIRRWRAGDRRPTECIRCNACFRPILTGRGFYCVLQKKKSVE